MPKWPPQGSTPTWTLEGNLIYDSSTQTLTASGVLNFSSTGTLTVLNITGYSPLTSEASITVTTKATGLVDTYQLQGSNDNSTWWNVDNAFSVTQAIVTSGDSARSWALNGYQYFRVNVTLDAGTTSTIVQTFYQLFP